MATPAHAQDPFLADDWRPAIPQGLLPAERTDISALAARQNHRSLDVEEGAFDLLDLDLNRPGQLTNHLIHGEVLLIGKAACAAGQIQAGNRRLKAKVPKQRGSRGFVRGHDPIDPRIKALVGLRANPKRQRLRLQHLYGHRIA